MTLIERSLADGLEDAPAAILYPHVVIEGSISSLRLRYSRRRPSAASAHRVTAAYWPVVTPARHKARICMRIRISTWMTLTTVIYAARNRRWVSRLIVKRLILLTRRHDRQGRQRACAASTAIVLSIPRTTARNFDVTYLECSLLLWTDTYRADSLVRAAVELSQGSGREALGR